MSSELIIVLVLIVVAIGLFVWERWQPAVVATLIMGVLMATGIITPAEALAGLSNEATVAVGAMFVLSGALQKTGFVTAIGEYLSLGISRRFWLALFALLISAGVLSAFINNTAVVAILIPVVLKSASDAGISPSKLLIPVSFVSMFGGVSTLIGTSTNLLVSSMIHRAGEAPIGMFEMTLGGLVFFAVGLVYLVLVYRFIPARRSPEDLASSDELADFVTDVQVTGAPFAGRRIEDTDIYDDERLDIVTVFHEQGFVDAPSRHYELREGDVLRVRGEANALEKLRRHEGLSARLGELPDEMRKRSDVSLVEVAVSPGSELDGRSLAEVEFRRRYSAVPLAILHRGRVQHIDLDRVRLGGGDIVLLLVPDVNVEQIREAEEFMNVSLRKPDRLRPSKTWLAVGTVAAVVLLATFDIMPIVASATLGAIFLLLSGALTFDEAIDAIEWNVIFLLAGVLGLGIALEKTGGDELLATAIIWVAEWGGPMGAVSFLYLATALLTSAMSNNATAALFVPIALASAAQLGIDERPLVMAVAFAASASFLTPVGYQTNTMIYGAGHYRFRDFFFIGGPLTLIFWGVATFLIPMLWPF